jgi:hypothetical protein
MIPSPSGARPKPHCSQPEAVIAAFPVLHGRSGTALFLYACPLNCPAENLANYLGVKSSKCSRPESVSLYRRTCLATAASGSLCEFPLLAKNQRGGHAAFGIEPRLRSWPLVGGLLNDWLCTFQERPRFYPSFGSNSLFIDRQLLVSEPLRGPKKQIEKVVQP